MDITKSNLPEADLIIIRDVIFHLHVEKIEEIFRNIKAKFKFIAITSCINEVNENNLNRWHFAERNLHLSPFNIGKEYIDCVLEDQFNRKFFIMTHDSFYRK